MVYKAGISVCFNKGILGPLSEILVDLGRVVVYILLSQTPEVFASVLLGTKHIPGNRVPFEKFWLRRVSLLQDFSGPLLTNIHMSFKTWL